MSLRVTGIRYFFAKATLVVMVLVLAAVNFGTIEPFLPKRSVSANPGDGKMLLFWDGGAAPSGWTCVSCTAGDPFYQIFPRGNSSYGGTGGAATSTHTTSNSIDTLSAGGVTNTQAGTVVSILGHTHSVSVTIGAASNLPSYRQLKVIRYNTNGEPATIPAGAIGMFDASVPAGWSAYSAQNGYYPYGEGTAGTTGGSNTHNHALTITIGAAAGTTYGVRNGGTQVLAANAGHTHTASGNSSTVNQEPPYISAIFGQVGSDSAPPNGLIAMWDNDAPSNWTMQSGASGAFYQNFFKASATYGTTGGAATHTHVNTVITTSGPSGSTLARSGTASASSSHTHTVTVGSYSTVSNLPPYRDVIIAKRVPQSTITQTDYRLFKNSNATDVGSALGAQSTASNTPRQSLPFRLRMLLNITTANLGIGNKTFKLQYAQRSGTCDVSFSGETYSDVSASSGAIRFYDNSSVNDGDNLTTNGNDPNSGNTVVGQTYEETNNFTSTSLVSTGQDGMWDFALVDYSAAASTNYCFRVVYSDGTPLAAYSVIPEIVTDDGNGHMILMYDGGSIPSGWSCVSCSASDDFYQKFFRGASSYGATGGSATHTHTATAAVGASNDNSTENNTGATNLASSGHTHTANVTIGSASNLPQYRQLKFIRADTSGVPSSLPAGAIAMYDTTLPAGWTQYSAQNGNFIRGEGTAGTTGGSATHTNPVSGTLTASVGITTARTTGGTQSTALDGHTHTLSGNTASANNEPPYIEAILASINATGSVPQNIIALWDGPMPGSWTDMSGSGQPFNGKFIKASATYGTTGGAATHTHANSAITSSAPSSTGNFRTGTGTASGVHTHSVTLSSISSESNIPPYIDVMIAKLGVANTAPNSPSSLDQKRTSNGTSIATGGYTNGGQVNFTATSSDTDNPDDLQLCVEVVPIASSFTNSPTNCGSSAHYTGTAVAVSVSVSGLINGTSYHWQVRTKDGSGATSAWVSYGGNAESAADFINDSDAPSGTVYDGTTNGVDVDFNSGSLSSLSANWNITDSDSGINKYEFAVGTTSGGNDVVDWSNLGTSTSYTANSLTLETSKIYYVSIRATDNAGNDIVITADGQQVAPSISFSTSSATVTFNNLNQGNSYTNTQATTLTTSTNAKNGYVVRARVTGLLQDVYSHNIGMFNGGTYASPDAWLNGDTGYGYTSSDTLVQGVNKFNPVTCAGGGSGPCYAPFAQSAPGDIVADHTAVVTGSPVLNESFVITHRVTVDALQNPGKYETVVVFSATATY